MSLTNVFMSDNRILAQFNELTKHLEKDDITLLLQLLRQNRGREFEVLTELMGYTYRWKPVGTREFIESEEYLGVKGQVFPKLLDDLEELFDSGQYDEAVMCGAIGWGKSTFAEHCMVRMVYEASCLRNPQRAYELADGTPISFVNVSLNFTQAKKVVFTGVKNKIMASPYFRNKFPLDTNNAEELRFPGNIWINPSVDPIGLNVYGGVIDEANFMGLVEKSKQARGGLYDQAKSLHDTLMRRMKSRFMRKGKMPRVLVSISSSMYPDDFTEKKGNEARDNSSIFFRRYSQWGTKPEKFFSDERFYVSLGDSSRKPKVCKDEEEAEALRKLDIQVIEVPIDYEQDFKIDLSGSIRDLAGYPTLTIKPFILQRNKIFEPLS